ncbi:hypothetical protein HDG41_008096 [Paraburkholderia sp. JPY162]|uniref:Uncharacterized protein n=3 Tax=Paraburkholderia TaxID=1822464 RepID=A0A7W8LFD7_9BURK|nr:hypothetical protein [Paraburkholderia youngii]
MLGYAWNSRSGSRGIRARFAVEPAFGLAWNTHIAFAIAHADDLRMRTVCLEYAQLLDSFEPFRALFLLYASLSAQMFLAQLLQPTYPRLQADHAEWQPLRRERKQTVYQETTNVWIGAISQTFGCPQMRQIELSGVLNRKYDRHLLHATKRLADVCAQHAIDIHLWVIEKPISRLQLRSIERLRKRAMRTRRKPTRQHHEPSGQASVAKFGSTKLFTCPVIEVRGVRQRPASQIMNGSKVNIRCLRLQAIPSQNYEQFVGNPEGNPGAVQ